MRDIKPNAPYNRGDADKSIGDQTGHMYFLCLQTLFSTGIDRFAEDTAKRARFVFENEHLFAGTVLCSTFAFLESTLGGKSDDGATWIERHGGRATRELLCLRTVRNAFVHSNSHVGDLQSATEEEKQQLRDFVADLQAGKITDDKGNVYPAYLSVTEDDVIVMKRDAIRIFTSIGKVLSH